MNNYKVGTRKTVTLMLTMAFCFMTVTGKIDTNSFMTVFTVIIGFYFGGSTALDDPLKKKGGSSNDNK